VEFVVLALVKRSKAIMCRVSLAAYPTHPVVEIINKLGKVLHFGESKKEKVGVESKNKKEK
jgi:hypothetical protein